MEPKFTLEDAEAPRRKATTPDIGDHPTLSALLALKEGPKVEVRVPRTTPDGIAYEAIEFNRGVKFMPGQTYKIHPIVAKELLTAINGFRNSILRQKTGRTIESPYLVAEVRAQEEANRRMYAEFEAAGVQV